MLEIVRVFIVRRVKDLHERMIRCVMEESWSLSFLRTYFSVAFYNLIPWKINSRLLLFKIPLHPPRPIILSHHSSFLPEVMMQCLHERLKEWEYITCDHFAGSIGFVAGGFMQLVRSYPFGRFFWLRRCRTLLVWRSSRNCLLCLFGWWVTAFMFFTN